MKSFHSFITEKKRNPGRPGGPGPSEAERAEAKGNTSKPNANPRRSSGPGARFRGPGSGLSVDDILRAARPKGSSAAIGPENAGVYFGSDKEAIEKAIELEKSARKGLEGAAEVDQSDAAAARQSGRTRRGKPVYDEPLVGRQRPRSRLERGFTIPTPGKPATRIPGGTGTYSGSLAKGTLKFSGDAKYRQELEKLGTKLADKVKRTSTSTTTATPTRVTSGDIDLGKVQSKSIKTSVPKVNVTTSQNIDLGKVATPAPKPSPTAIKVTNRASVDLPSTYRPKLRSGPQVKVSVPASLPKAAPVTRVAPQPAVAKPTTSNVKVKPQAPSNVRIKAQPKSVAGAAADDVMKQMGSHMRKGARIASRTAGAAGALYDIGSEFATLKKMGASNVKAATGSVVRAAGGALGGAIGAGLGAPAGPVGSIPGAIAGYTVGADTASRLFDRIAGAPDEKTTPEKIKKNTARLANDAKKTFGQFTSGLGKAYTGFVRPEYRR